MKFARGFLFYLFVVLVGHASDAGPLVQELESSYAAIQSIEASFQQEYFSPRFGLQERQNGRVLLKFPGRMKWLYENPPKEIVVSPKQSWIYDKADKQVFKSTGSLSLGALSLLTGGAKIDATFRVAPVETTAAQALLILFPKKPLGDTEKLKVTFDRRKKVITALSVFDSFGNENKITFTQIQTNRPIANEQFEFRVPKGVTLFEPPNEDRKN